jgi:NADH/NAD ratio-sensing transcriptional regulator Rex
MIAIDNVLDYLKSNQLKTQNIRNENYHLSEVAICGFKYRHKIENNIEIPFNFNFLMGNAFENLIVYNMRKLGNIIPQYIVRYEEFIGHTDAYDVDTKIIYELKSSFAFKSYEDIYLRQLKAYLIANNTETGILWIYKPVKKEFTEIIVDLEEEDILNFKNNIIAFTENKYVKGIENSLCSFCENTDCPAYKKIKGII